MDFEWTDEQELLRESVRRFLDENASLDFVRERWDDLHGTTAAVWSGFADLGATGLLVPESQGGAGLGLLDMGVVLEELGRVVHPGPLLSSAVVATRLLQAVGSDAERHAWLPRLAAGTARLTAALENDDAALEVAGPPRGLRVSGSLAPVLDAAAADALLVPARVGGAARVLLVERAAEGVSLAPFGQVDGTRRLFRIGFEGAPALLLGDGPAEAALAEARDVLAVGLAVDAVGAAGRALELATAYALEREQFGRPIGSFQAVQHLLVDMLQAVELTRAAALHALWSVDAAPPHERSEAVSIAKACAAEALPGVGASAIQVFGGIGFTWEMDVHLFDKRLSSQALLGGDAAHHLEVLAAIALDGS